MSISDEVKRLEEENAELRKTNEDLKLVRDALRNLLDLVEGLLGDTPQLDDVGEADRLLPKKKALEQPQYTVTEVGGDEQQPAIYRVGPGEGIDG